MTKLVKLSAHQVVHVLGDDRAYLPDLAEKVFKFTPRDGVFTLQLPAYLPKAAEVFRLDSDGTDDVKFSLGDGRITLRDRVNLAGIYVVSARPGLRREMQTRHATLMAFEKSFGLDPISNDSDFATLQRLLR